MQVPKYQILDLYNNKKLTGLAFKVNPLSSDADGSDKDIHYRDFSDETARSIEKNSDPYVRCQHNDELQALLLQNFPDYYKPGYSDRLGVLRMYIEQFEMANSLSKGKKIAFRFRCMKNLKAVSSSEGDRFLVDFNESLDLKMMEFLRTRFSDEMTIQYSSSEKGILLVNDPEGYANNPKQIKLQFQVRKVFKDLAYKRVLSVQVSTAFQSYFKSMEGNEPKLVLLCGRTPAHLYLEKQLRVFDPFCKIMILTVDDLSKDADEIFDTILPKLGSDYAYESLLYDPTDVTKENLPPEETREFRDRFSKLSREFSIRSYIDLEYQVIERMKRYVVVNQQNHLKNILDGFKISKDVIFSKLLDDPFA